MDELTLEQVFPVSADKIYRDFLDSETHSMMTGDTAVISDKKGAKFTAWGGYISGKNLELVPGKKIRQRWRTTDFSKKDKDSEIEITLEEIGSSKTKFTLKHTKIPDGDGNKYKEGWQDYYLAPMLEHYLAPS